MPSARGRGSSGSSRALLLAPVIPAAATTLAFLPEFFRAPSAVEQSPLLTVAWLGILLVAGPLSAYATNRRSAVATTAPRSVWVGVLQPPLAVALVALDIGVDVQSGYLLAGSGEEAMSYGIGIPAALLLGLFLLGLVAVAARLGARRAQAGPP